MTRERDHLAAERQRLEDLLADTRRESSLDRATLEARIAEVDRELKTPALSVDEAFERYFHARADLADELVSRGYGIEGCGIATAALDALGAIWFNDFPSEAKAIERGRGKVPASVRMSRMLQRFAPRETLAQRVAVVCFAEDLQRYAPDASATASRLLARRRGTVPGELPHAYEDKPVNLLLEECPELSTKPAVSFSTNTSTRLSFIDSTDPQCSTSSGGRSERTGSRPRKR